MGRRAIFTAALCIGLLSAGCARDGDAMVARAVQRRQAVMMRKQAESITRRDSAPRPAWRFAAADDDTTRSAPRRDFWPRFDSYARDLPDSLWRDTKAVAANRFSVATLLVAGVAGAVTAGSGLDERVADHYTKRGGNLNKFWDSTGGFAGSPALHLPLAGAAVLGSMAMDNKVYQGRSETLLNALAINGITTLALKGAFRTESPNGDPFGWPSGHSSSSFCFATVLHHQYGPWVGVPLLGFASFVAYQRVDARNHDLSDVISGSLIGIAIGHGVAAAGDDAKIFGMEVIPYVDPSRDVMGIAFIKRW